MGLGLLVRVAVRVARDVRRHESARAGLKLEHERDQHSTSGHFRRWGGCSPPSGRPGYDLTLATCPNFHRMGGIARSPRAKRNKLGQFTR